MSKNVSQARYFKFRSRPEAVAAARQALAGFEHLLALSVFYDASLCVSELVTNAVLHAANASDEELELCVEINDHVLVVAVIDPGSGFEAGGLEPTPGEESGWGLYIVDRLSDRWGVDRSSRTRVWFEMAVRAEQEVSEVGRDSRPSDARSAEVRASDGDDGRPDGRMSMRRRLRPHATR